MGRYDSGGKQIIHHYNQAWSEWVLQNEQIQVEEELSGEFRFIARSNDSLLKVIGKDGPFLSLTELQFIYDATMPERLAAYKLLTYQKYKLDVFVTVVYFLPPPDSVTTVATAYHNEFMGQRTHIDFRVIKIWELDAAEVLAYNNPMLLPFVPLMKGGNNTEMVRRCAERIRKQAEVETAAELEAILAIFAGYVLDVTVIRQILRWDMQIVRESPIMQEMRQIWRQEALDEMKPIWRQEVEEEVQERIKRDVRKAALQALKQSVTIRFGVDFRKFDDLLRFLTVDTLQKLNETALKVNTPDEFEAKLNEVSQLKISG